MPQLFHAIGGTQTSVVVDQIPPQSRVILLRSVCSVRRRAMSRSLQRQILERAEAYLSSGFAKLTEATDVDGAEVRWDSKLAVNFCAMGAIKRATRDVLGSYGRKGTRLANGIIEKCHDRSEFEMPISILNDCRGRAPVLRQLRRTVERQGW
jgi:hypothetical protein